MRRFLAKLGLIALLVVVITVGLILFQPHWFIALLAIYTPDVIYYVDTQRPVIALTIDDGPDPATTPKILELLARHGAKATFFVIGSRASNNQPTLEKIVDNGHELGNHLMTDHRSINVPVQEYEGQMLEARRLLSDHTETRWVRPGSGWFSAEMLDVADTHNHRTVLGSIYPHDPHIPLPGFAAWHILRKARPGAIVILHDHGSRGERTLETLRLVLPELARRGYRIVTLSELDGVTAN